MPVMLSFLVPLTISLCPFGIFLSFLGGSDMYVITLLISGFHLGRYGAHCLWLGGPSKAAFSSCWAGVWRALQKCTLPCSAAPKDLERGAQASPGQGWLHPSERGDDLKHWLVLYCWGSPCSLTIQPDLCLPLGRQERGKGGERIVGRRKRGQQPGSSLRVWRWQEAILRQHWRQEGAAMFGVEPEEHGLGKKRCARFHLSYINI